MSLNKRDLSSLRLWIGRWSILLTHTIFSTILNPNFSFHVCSSLMGIWVKLKAWKLLHGGQIRSIQVLSIFCQWNCHIKPYEDRFWICHRHSGCIFKVSQWIKHQLQIHLSVIEGQSWWSAIIKTDRGLYHQEKRVGTNLIPVTISHWNQFYWTVWETFASTNSYLLALSCHFGLQWSRKLRLEFCNSHESLNYQLPTLGDF